MQVTDKLYHVMLYHIYIYMIDLTNVEQFLKESKKMWNKILIINLVRYKNKPDFYYKDKIFLFILIDCNQNKPFMTITWWQETLFMNDSLGIIKLIFMSDTWWIFMSVKISNECLIWTIMVRSAWQLIIHDINVQWERVCGMLNDEGNIG